MVRGGQVRIDFENGRRHVNMSRDEWKLLFDQAGIPNTRWDEMLGCLEDWQDENDEHGLNGAESDDSFYVKREYECKNAPIDTVDELLLIKNWGAEVLYGTPPEELEDTDDPILGLADQLTVWGDGKINPNSATMEVLNSVSTLSDDKIASIIEWRLGLDGIPGTKDDGITPDDFNALGLDSSLFSLVPDYVCL
ncbi:MAG: general secretion pathway protein GspK [Kiritimatiellaceae bacterium]|nr:general secretion pathway protein GspK [Kiritimatiellaceae bacterium]